MGVRNLRLPVTDLENNKEGAMKLHDWEQTIQQIVEESNREPKESGKSRVLMDWRTDWHGNRTSSNRSKLMKSCTKFEKGSRSSACNQAAVFPPRSR